MVNLVVTSNGQTVFWNGPFTTPNGMVNGGTGTWDNVTTHTNWTDASGTISGPYNGMNAVFEGSTGIVTLGDNIAFTTLEFHTTGYAINADAGNQFAMTPATGATITTDTGLTATINAPLVGSGGISTLGGGTLILGGNNTSTSGATVVTNGTLQAGSSTSFSPTSAFTVNTPGILDIHGFSPIIGSLAGTWHSHQQRRRHRDPDHWKRWHHDHIFRNYTGWRQPSRLDENRRGNDDDR